MAGLKVRRIGYALGAAVTGLDCSQPLDPATIDEIGRVWMEHPVLCFPGQNLEPEQMQAFCGRFGPLDDNRDAPDNRIPGLPHVKTLSNRFVNVAGTGYKGERTGRKWHSDQSYTDHPATATFLHAKQLPDVGGDTMFANLYMAFETLSPSLQAILETLEGVHDHTLSGNYVLKSPEEQAEDRRRSPPIVHPMVNVHPVTGRKSLFVSSRVRQFFGMTEEESRPWLDFLNEHAVRYEFTYRHRWTVGDLVMWDNRYTQHIAVQDYDQNQIRRMYRCTLLGPKSGKPFLAEPAVLAPA